MNVCQRNLFCTNTQNSDAHADCTLDPRLKHVVEQFSIFKVTVRAVVLSLGKIEPQGLVESVSGAQRVGSPHLYVRTPSSCHALLGQSVH